MAHIGRILMSQKKIFCTPTCKHFQCAGGHISIKFTRQGKRLVMCNWAGDLCIGYKCKFASCKINKLMSDGTCALRTQISRKQEHRKKDFEEFEITEELPIDELQKRIKSKDLKKIKDWDLYY